MIIKNAEFITSVANDKNFLVYTDKPIIAVSGKSNVGKSSFINMLANRKKLAKTSNTPGRTRLVNYFDFGQFILADLPGYGFAQVSKAEKEKWGKLMNSYFMHARTVNHVFALVDIRHKPTADDVAMINFLHHYAIPFTIIATKSDKLGKAVVGKQLKEIAATFALMPGDIIAVSNETREGKEKVLSCLDKISEVFNATDETLNEEEVDENVTVVNENIIVDGDKTDKTATENTD